MSDSKRVHWLIGRGASIECGLRWTVPKLWVALPRRLKIYFIKRSIIQEMAGTNISFAPYEKLLKNLRERTRRSWDHFFITTNWDYLLQTAILNEVGNRTPHWLADSTVYHLNGTAEILGKNENRSPFLLESDSWRTRDWTPEANVAFQNICWGTVFVLVGMSLECQSDRFLISALSTYEDDLPIGGSTWIVINPDNRALRKARKSLQKQLPRATIIDVNLGLSEWIACGMEELKTIGSINPCQSN